MPVFDRLSFIAVKIKSVKVIVRRMIIVVLPESDGRRRGWHMFLGIFVVIAADFQELSVAGEEGVQIVACCKVADDYIRTLKKIERDEILSLLSRINQRKCQNRL